MVENPEYAQPQDVVEMSEAEGAQYNETAGWHMYLNVKQAQDELRRESEMFDLRQREREEKFDARQRQIEEMFDARMQERNIKALLSLAEAGANLKDMGEPEKDFLADIALGKTVEAYPTSRTESVNTIFDNTLDDLIEQASQRISETYSEKISSTILNAVETKLSEIESRIAGIEAQIGE